MAAPLITQEASAGGGGATVEPLTLELFVDAGYAGLAPSDGSIAAPFTTITAAYDALKVAAAGAPMPIIGALHVAPGLYDEDLVFDDVGCAVYFEGLCTLGDFMGAPRSVAIINGADANRTFGFQASSQAMITGDLNVSMTAAVAWCSVRLGLENVTVGGSINAGGHVNAGDCDIQMIASNCDSINSPSHSRLGMTRSSVDNVAEVQYLTEIEDSTIDTLIYQTQIGSAIRNSELSSPPQRAGGGPVNLRVDGATAASSAWPALPGQYEIYERSRPLLRTYFVELRAAAVPGETFGTIDMPFNQLQNAADTDQALGYTIFDGAAEVIVRGGNGGAGLVLEDHSLRCTFDAPAVYNAAPIDLRKTGAVIGQGEQMVVELLGAGGRAWGSPGGVHVTNTDPGGGELFVRVRGAQGLHIEEQAGTNQPIVVELEECNNVRITGDNITVRYARRCFVSTTWRVNTVVHSDDCYFYELDLAGAPTSGWPSVVQPAGYVTAPGLFRTRVITYRTDAGGQGQPCDKLTEALSGGIALPNGDSLVPYDN